MKKVKKRKTRKNNLPGRTSPKSSKKGCLCDDNTYHVDCCDGTVHAQGIGKV